VLILDCQRLVGQRWPREKWWWLSFN